jgi:hypothetical protein
VPDANGNRRPSTAILRVALADIPPSVPGLGCDGDLLARSLLADSTIVAFSPFNGFQTASPTRTGRTIPTQRKEACRFRPARRPLRTSCDSLPPTSTDCSSYHEAATSLIVAALLLQA